MNWQKERFSQKQLTSESFDNDNKLTLKSFFAFCQTGVAGVPFLSPSRAQIPPFPSPFWRLPRRLYACRNADLNLTLVTRTTNAFVCQIINLLIESWWVRLTCLDCNFFQLRNCWSGYKIVLRKRQTQTDSKCPRHHTMVIKLYYL